MITYEAGAVLDALGDPTRRAVFDGLRQGPRAVGDLAADLPVTRPAVSQHLRVLKDAGLVTDRAVGTRRVYEIDPRGLAPLRSYLEAFWSDVLGEFKRAAAGWGPAATAMSDERRASSTDREGRGRRT